MKAQEQASYLPQLKKGLVPRIAAAHGLVGYGNCSLSIPMAVVAAGGSEVCPLPSSVLSAHTAFPHFYLMDTTQALEHFLQNWQEIGFAVDGLYSGFLGSVRQIDLIKAFCRQYPAAYRIIDPVMGDKGARYATFTDELCAGIRELLPLADVLLPNLTEAAILTGRPYKGQTLEASEGEAICTELLELGAKHVILKGMQRGEHVYNAVMGIALPYTEVENRLYPASMYGTGDLFASCVTAALFSGRGLEEAVAFASQLVCDAIIFSLKQPGSKLRGVCFEPFLGRVAAFCRREDFPAF